MKLLIRSTSFLFQSLLFLFLAIAVFVGISSRTSLAAVRSFVVLTGSMQPALPVGSVVFSTPSLSYEVGDIITFKNQAGQTVTHRLVAKSVSIPANIYKTAGDANSVPDGELITGSQILGKVVYTLPYLGHLASFLRTPVGFISLLVIPALAFIVWQIITIIKEVAESTQKQTLAKFNLYP